MMQMQMGSGPAMQNPGKMFDQEKETMTMYKHRFALKTAEKEFLEKSREFLEAKNSPKSKKQD
jgi:hypothetical protein